MRKKLRVVAAIAGIVIAAAFAAYQVSPWPAVWVIRYVFAKGAERASASSDPFVPANASIEADVRYGPGPDEVFDVFIPDIAEKSLPAVVWVHGGGFVAGSRADLTNYLRALAARGFVSIAVGYTRAPDARFPTPVRQTNQALAHLVTNAQRFQIDPERLFIAGDSAGAQIAAQAALVISDPSYAKRLGIEPGIARKALRGAVLFCGPHDPIGRKPAWFFRPYIRTIVWSYMGTRNLEDPSVKNLSVVPHVTSSFPPAFISAGNDDPLAPQSIALATALRERGVEVDTLFFPDNYDPPLGHEYQMFLSRPEAREALDRYVEFLDKHAGE